MTDKAVKHAQRTRCSLSQAAKKFGVSRQAVHQRWTELELGPPPVLANRQRRRDVIQNLLASGKTMNQIATSLGVTTDAIRYHVKKHRMRTP